MPIDPPDTRERLARVEQMIEEFRVARQRRLQRRAMQLWRKAEAHQRLMALEAPPDRVH